MEAPTILAVDDEVPTLRIIRTTLKRAGYTVVTACDGAEALEKMETFRPDVIVADVMMPRLGGFDLVKVLKENPLLATIPVILLTSLGRYEDAKMGYKAGADYYLNKPFSLTGLLAAVEKALSSAHRS